VIWLHITGQESSVALQPDTGAHDMPSLQHTNSSRAIVCPECPKCGTQMMLARIEPEAPGEDRRTFECPVCEHSESILVN
jgi:hypothetical protein